VRRAALRACAALCAGAGGAAASSALDAGIAEHVFEALRPRGDTSASPPDDDAATSDGLAALASLCAAAPPAFRRRLVFGASALASRLRLARAAGDAAAFTALASLLQSALDADPVTMPRPMALALAGALGEHLAAIAPEGADGCAETGQPLSPEGARAAAAACGALGAMLTWLPFGEDAAAGLGRSVSCAAAALRHATAEQLFGSGTAFEAPDDVIEGGSIAPLFPAVARLAAAWLRCCGRGAETLPAAAASAADAALAAADAHIVPIGLAAVAAPSALANGASAASLFELLAALLDDAGALPAPSRAAAAAKLAAHGGVAAAFAPGSSAAQARPACAAFLGALLFAHPARDALAPLLADVA
jgi:hypothetical protein